MDLVIILVLMLILVVDWICVFVVCSLGVEGGYWFGGL